MPQHAHLLHTLQKKVFKGKECFKVILLFTPFRVFFFRCDKSVTPPPKTGWLESAEIFERGVCVDVPGFMYSFFPVGVSKDYFVEGRATYRTKGFTFVRLPKNTKAKINGVSFFEGRCFFLPGRPPGGGRVSQPEGPAGRQRADPCGGS